MNTLKPTKIQRGFTLIEIAIVLIIFGFLLVATTLPLKAQRDIAKQLETEELLDKAKTALLGFAQSNGYLPCPATNNGSASFPDDTGSENRNTDGSCTTSIGLLPASTLGLNPIDNNGFALDAWNNRIFYTVTTANANAFTTNKMNNIGLSFLDPDLRVCSTSTAANCTDNLNLINNAVAVIFSTGPTGGQTSGGVDEFENTNNDGIFVSHTPNVKNAPNGEFDHIVTWLSPYILYNAMIQSGQLH
jgi:prepilin-type N-terminal cleavage/methylation domain-containing protein